MRTPSWFAVGALCAAATACWSDDRPIRWDRARTVLGPVALKTHVAYIDSALDRVVLVDVSGDRPAVAHTAIGRRAMYAVPSEDRHRLFVITRGEQAVHTGEIDQPPMFWVVDAQHPGVAQSYPIGSPPSSVGVVPGARQAFVAQRHPLGRMSFVALSTGAVRTVTGFDLNSQIVDH